MAKKKTKKRHIPRQPKSSAAADAPIAQPVTTAHPSVPVAGSGALILDRSDYARQDVRRIGLLAVGFMVVLLAAWALFNYTSAGQYVYGLIKV